MDFVNAAGELRIIIFDVTIVAGSVVDTPKINIQGTLGNISQDNVGAVYFGVPVGTEFFFEIDLQTGLSTISDGTTITPFTADFVDGSFLEIINDLILDADDVLFVNSLAGTSFVVGDSVDVILIQGGSLTSGGGLIEVELVYVLDSLALADTSPDNYPPESNDGKRQINDGLA